MRKSIRKSCIALLLLFCLYGCSGAPKSEYYIDPPKDSDFNSDNATFLTDSYIDLIRELVPKVTEWYNSIDISEPVSLDFVPEEIQDLMTDLFTTDNLTAEVLTASDTALKNEEKEKQVMTIHEIQGEISKIISYCYNNKNVSEDTEDPTAQIEKDSWVELGDKIKEVIQFYYN